VETYLAPIYRSEASFVVPIMGKDYPDRLWTRFESKQFADRFGENAVFPVWFSGVSHGTFERSREHGGFEVDRAQALDPQVERIAEQLAIRLKAFRLNGKLTAPAVGEGAAALSE
jgi:hypothetical protein